MNIIKWLDERTGLATAFNKIANMKAPGGKFCCRALPVSLVFLFLLQAITGVFLWAFYSPSATSAWESVFYIQYVLPLGWLVRGIHHYSAQLFVAFSGLYVFFLILHGACRRPREFVYWSALVMFLLSLCSCLTGDLLPWSQSGYFATITRVSFLQLLPGIGVPLYQLVAGGPDPQFGTLTLTRFLFLHVCVFGGGGFLTLCLWKYFDIRSRTIIRNEKRFDGVHKCCLACADKKVKPFWSCNAFMVGVTCVVVFALVLLLVFQRSLCDEQIAKRAETLPAQAYLGAELTGPVDVSSSFDAARPEWSFRALYTMTKLPIFSKIGMVYAIFVVPPLLVAFFFLIPILSRSKSLHCLCVLLTVILAIVAVDFTYRSYYDDYSPESEHSASFKEGVAEVERTADRTVELAFAPEGIPKTGALELLKKDPFTQGPVLFDKHCASCHNFKAASPESRNPDYIEIECSDPTAPNLYGARSADWIRGFTHEETLSDVDCFGATAFAEKGSMIGFMKGRVAGGLTVEDGSFMLNGSGLIAKVIAADASPAFDVLSSVFEDFCEDEENLELLKSILNEDDELADEQVEAAKTAYVAKLKELLTSKLEDEEFIGELDPRLPAPVLDALKEVLVKTLDDETYREILFDEEAIELVQDDDYEDLITDTYLATLNGNDEPIPAGETQYIDRIRQGLFVACDDIAEILAEEAKLDAPRPYLDGEYLGLAPNAINDMSFMTCTECHAFYGTENDHACDLRAYMSRDWVAGFISDPTTPRFYGAKNDRMPSYCPEVGDKLMTEEEVALLADWLSGMWYRAPKVDNSLRVTPPGLMQEASAKQSAERQEKQAELQKQKDELNARIAQAEADRRAADEEAAKAKQEKEQQAKEKMQKDLSDAQKASKDATATIKALETELNDAKTSSNNLQKRIEELTEKSQLDEAKALEEKNALQGQSDKAIQDLKDQLGKEKAAAAKNVEDLRAQYQQALNLQKDAADQRIADSNKALEASEQAKNEAQTRVQELTGALRDARDQLQKALDETNALKEQLREAQSNSPESDAN